MYQTLAFAAFETVYWLKSSQMGKRERVWLVTKAS